jgi:predicted Zn-dependent peptidase
MVWESHPYGWPVVGWPSDIPAISKAEADDFYSTYYAPQNTTLVLVGDFKSADAVAMAEKYFTRIPKGKKPVPEVVTLEVKQVAEKRMYADAETNPQVDVAWHTVPYSHRDSYPLGILGQILATRTGRFYKGMVLGSKIANDVSASPYHRKWAGLFYASGEAKDGHTPEEVETGLYAEIEKLKGTLVPAEELQKVKNNFAASEYRRLTSNMSILMQLIQSDGLGDWREINQAGPKYQAVTAEDIQRVAKAYFTKENRNVAIYRRKAGASSDDKSEAKLTPQQKSMIEKMASRLKTEKDAGKLQKALDALDKQAARADEKTKPVLEAQKKLLQERLKELQ